MEKETRTQGYQVRNYEKAPCERDASWTPVAAAGVHKDGHGFNIALEALPLDGRLVMRLRKTDEKKAAKAKTKPQGE